MNFDREELLDLVRRGRRAKQRGEALRGCATRSIVIAVTTLYEAWLLMLGVGVLHAQWWPAIPTIGYWTAVVAVFLLRGVFSRIPPTSAKKVGAS